MFLLRSNFYAESEDFILISLMLLFISCVFFQSSCHSEVGI